MKKKIANVLIILGAVLMFAAFSILIFNYYQSYKAFKNAENVLVHLESQITENRQSSESNKSTEQQEIVIDGNKYIGYLSLPKFELELPVMDYWSYKKLRTAPCRYYGSVEDNNFVIMAHNYSRHFGKISKLKSDDVIVFTDLNGKATEYIVVAQDILDPYSVTEFQKGDYDLTLFTCTYGGQNRVAIYCDKK